MATYILSDLHLQDRAEKFLFNHDKEAVFLRVADEVLADPDGQLVFAGDVFDFTSMMPPTKGLVEFFEETLTPEHFAKVKDKPEFQKVFGSRSTTQLLNDINREYPKFFTALSSLAKQQKLTCIIGNHDCVFQNAEAQSAFAQVLGCAPANIKWATSLELGRYFVAAHGHEFDKPNKIDHGCFNAGWAITSTLYCAVGPALRELGVAKDVVDALPAVRPEEEIVAGLGHYLGDEKARALLIAFVKLLERNGYFRHGIQFIMWFLIHSVPLISWAVKAGVTPARVRRALPSEESLKEMGRKGAAQIHRLHPDSIVIMGHTHALDFTSNYVNLGTWIDHVDGLSPDQVRAADATLPVLVIENAAAEQKTRAKLFDAREVLSRNTQKLADCKVIWQSDEP